MKRRGGRAPRIAIIGPRRVRQGLGPFAARELARAGAEIPCLLATSEESAAAAEDQLAAVAGIRARPYTELSDMLEREELDALAILSPSLTHRVYLEAAIEGGLSAFCEKPLVWGAYSELARGPEIARGFAKKGLVLHENCQWPQTLESYEELHPGSLRIPPQRFEMRLSPLSSGCDMLGDALSHPLSVLQALLPADNARLKDIAFSGPAPATAEVEVRFYYEALAGPKTGAIDCRVILKPGLSLPREAGYALDGRWAARVVRMKDYAQFFADGHRLVDVPDPLARTARRFVAALETRPQEGHTAERQRELEREAGYIAQRMELLTALTQAFAAHRS